MINEYKKYLHGVPRGTVIPPITRKSDSREETGSPSSSSSSLPTFKTKADAIAWVKSLQPHGATNIFDSLETAFSYAGAKPSRSPEEARPGRGVQTDLAKEGIDTIYLLSDGIANRGKVQLTDDILKKIREMNMVRKVALHTIAVGSDADEALMESLAKENGGNYVKH